KGKRALWFQRIENRPASFCINTYSARAFSWEQVPFVPVEIFENCHCSIRFLSWLLFKLDVFSLHSMVVTPEIVSVHKEEDPSASLIPNTGELLRGRCLG